MTVVVEQETEAALASREIRLPRRSVERDVETLSDRLVWSSRPARRVMRVFVSNSPSWLEPTLGSFSQLMGLGPNWDGHGAQAPSPESVRRALRFLASHLRPQTAPPAVVPLVDGGVQAEWSRGGVDVEIVFRPTGETSLYVEDLDTGEAWEGPLDGEAEQRLASLLDRLAGHGAGAVASGP